MGIRVSLSVHGGLQSARFVPIFAGFEPALEQFGLESGMFAYSLRQVANTENNIVSSTGQPLCIRVRRSNDNAEQDISFNGEGLDIAALETFCEGGADAYVKIWYNQLGNAFGVDTTHFATATPAQQPPIVLNGSVLTDPVTGLPAMRFSGSRYLQYTETGGSYTDSSGWSTENLTTLTAAYSLFFIGQSYRTSASGKIVEGSTTSNQVILSDDSISYRVDGGGATLSLSDDGFTNLYAWEIERDASNGLGLFKNNTDLITTTTTQAGTFELRDLGEDLGGDVFEFIGYPSSQSQRDALFANLDEYYTITEYAHTPTTYTNAFVSRVVADGGSVESTSCLIADLKAFAFDTGYQVILNRGTTEGYSLPSASQQTLQNTLVTDLKSSGVWDKLDMLFVFANNGSEEYSLIDWKNPTGTLGIGYSDIAWASNTGFTGDGIADYIETGHIAGTTGAGGETPQFTANDASMGIYSLTEYSSGALNDYPISSNASTQRIRFFESSSGGNRFLTTGSYSGAMLTGASQRGMMGIQKNASGSIQALAGDKTLGNARTGLTDIAPVADSLKIFRYSSTYGEGNVKLAWVGSKFSTTEWEEYVTAVDTYIAAL